MLLGQISGGTYMQTASSSLISTKFDSDNALVSLIYCKEIYLSSVLCQILGYLSNERMFNRLALYSYTLLIGLSFWGVATVRRSSRRALENIILAIIATKFKTTLAHANKHLMQRQIFPIGNLFPVGT